MRLSDQNVIIAFIPLSSPILVRPTQTKRKINILILQHVPQWKIKEYPASKPIEIVTESVNSVLLCQLCLTTLHLWQPKVVEAELSRQVRLVMTGKRRSRLTYVRPFRKSRSPRLIIFRDRVKLWQVERDAAHRAGNGPGLGERNVFNVAFCEISRTGLAGNGMDASPLVQRRQRGCFQRAPKRCHGPVGHVVS